MNNLGKFTIADIGNDFYRIYEFVCSIRHIPFRNMQVYNRDVKQAVVDGETQMTDEIVTNWDYCISPILNFHTSIFPINLTQECVITQPTETELRIIEPKSNSDKSGHWKLIIRCHDDESCLLNVIKALQLYKEDSVNLGATYYFKYDKFIISCEGTELYDVVGLNKPNKYRLLKKEIDGFLQLFNKLNSLDYDNNMRINEALVRLGKSYEMGLMHAPVDILIGLESLYLKDNQEIAYKLSLRAAYLLADTKSERRQIFDTIRKAYRIRSGLVHGNDILSTIKTRTELDMHIQTIFDARTILRKSIRKFLDIIPTSSHNELLNKLLDDNILSGNQSL